MNSFHLIFIRYVNGETMVSDYIIRSKRYILNTDKYVCNKFGLAEVFAKHFDDIYNDCPTFILDVGCGVGPLSIFLADKYHCHITATDINSKACELCITNIEKYNLQYEISILQADFRNFSNTYKDIKYDLIVSAPPVDENITSDEILNFSAYDLSSLDDKSFSFITNSWCDECGKDLSDYIFSYAKTHLNNNGSIILVFCDIDCKSTNYIVNKALTHGFCVLNSVDSFILPQKLGVENFIQRNICVHLMRFTRR